MEESKEICEGVITGIKFSLATHEDFSTSSINECPINHASQLANPFLGLPLETGKCESCGASEFQQCEGHFGFIELPVPIYHPCHVVGLRQMLSLLCLKCLKFKGKQLSTKNSGGLEQLFACCEETSHIAVKDRKTADGARFIELKVPSKLNFSNGIWKFLERYGYSYGAGHSRTLLPSEVLAILEELPDQTKKKLAKKGHFPQEGYILRSLPVPPNCLSVPDISDGVSVVSDLASTMLKKVLKQIEIIQSTGSVEQSFESDEVVTNELQVAVSQYFQVRGVGAASNEVGKPYGAIKEASKIAPKAWLEKMKTLFISKGSGSSSRSVITGDTYKRVNEIGLPSEIAQRITLDEKVNVHNIKFLQSLVDKKLCLSFRDDVSAYSLKEGSKGHTLLKPGQVVHRRIMDGDVVFINRPPTTHKHSLQALRVYIHENHTVKINPLMCGPLGADFDGDCVHVFYPQSLAARAEVLELFSVEKQLLSSHTGNLNLQLSTDALLSLKKMFKENFFNKLSAQHLSMFARHPLPPPALQKECASVPSWTALEILQTTFPAQFHFRGDQHLIQRNDILKADFNRDVMQSTLDEIIASIVFEKGPNEVLHFFDSLLPLLMENLYSEGHSVSLEDFIIPLELLEDIQEQMQDVSALMFQLKASYNELVEQQIESDLRHIKRPVVTFTLTSSALGSLIDSKSESAINKIVQQIGFLGIQLYDRGKFYSKTLVDDMAHLFHQKYPYRNEFPCEEFGLVKSAFFQGLDPYEELVHSIASREVIIRSSRGLTEPGTLFKNLMAILRDVAICYDGTVRTVSSNSIIQFEYGVHGEKSEILFPPGEPVGVLAATAMSNPAYKAVLDSSPSSNSSWDTMKEILFSNVKFKNDVTDRRVILYLNSCKCGRKFCRENASCTLKNLLKKVSLKDAAEEFLIEYKKPSVTSESDELGNGLVGHIHLSKDFFYKSNISMRDILDKCEDEVNPLRKKKKFTLFRRILLSVSECCPFSHRSECSGSVIPCLKFFWNDIGESGDAHLDKASRFMADVICPVLLGTIIKGDPRISAVNIIWINPDTSTWIGNPNDCQIGELAVEVVVDSKAVKRSGDAYRVALDCCLPVLHLIDTRRMIPHSVKQIQQVLGISCAFDQAVQRLSTSVKMVAKGVLKEHLILLGSSMTSTGDLIGFNSGGIKAMYSTSGVQAPFTEATLHTPKKCFERAAEKCCLDSLSSVVGSCCWGKPVAVGTGAKVDILWNEKEAPLEKESIDVYDFLQLVRSPQGEEDGDHGCLGEDVDTFEKEDENMIECPSPKDSKAVFEDDEVKVLTYDDWRSCGVKKQATKDSTALAQNSQSHGPRFEYGWESKRRNPETSSVLELPLKARSQGWSYPNEDSNDKYTPIEVVYESPPGLNNQREDLLGWFSPDELRPSSRRRGRGSGRGRGTGRGVETTPRGGGHGSRGRGRGRGRGAQSSWGPREASGRGRGSGSGRGRGRDRGRGAQSSWGKAETSGWMKKGSDFVRGFSSNARGTRNTNRNQPPRAHGPVYTPEEQNILSEVEPIMKSVRRIMHQEGYIDGQPISIEDQRFIVQNVLVYHPDRDAKRGCGIDHIMVSKHSRYQDTRCLYVVSTDGQRRDFSYKKCIENMIRNKHPYHAQSFISKYWKN